MMGIIHLNRGKDNLAEEGSEERRHRHLRAYVAEGAAVQRP